VGIGTDCAGQIGAINIRQHEIEHHQIGALGARQTERRRAIIRGQGLKSGMLQIGADQSHDLTVVINDQNTLRHTIPSLSDLNRLYQKQAPRRCEACFGGSGRRACQGHWS
jgi:hypothetical protein